MKKKTVIISDETKKKIIELHRKHWKTRQIVMYLGIRWTDVNAVINAYEESN